RRDAGEHPLLPTRRSSDLVGYILIKLSDVSSNTQQELERGETSEKRDESVSPGKDNISMLFLGVDDRDGDLAGRTDAMLLATFKDRKSTRLNSSHVKSSYA